MSWSTTRPARRRTDIPIKNGSAMLFGAVWPVPNADESCGTGTGKRDRSSDQDYRLESSEEADSESRNDQGPEATKEMENKLKMEILEMGGLSPQRDAKGTRCRAVAAEKDARCFKTARQWAPGCDVERNDREATRAYASVQTKRSRSISGKHETKLLCPKRRVGPEWAADIGRGGGAAGG